MLTLMPRGGKILVSALFALIILFSSTPIVVAAEGIVPCGDQTYSADEATQFNSSHDAEIKAGTVSRAYFGSIKNPCDWNYLISGITKVTNYFIILGAAVSALAFGYAGLLMMTAQGEMGKIEEARAIFGKVLIGFLIMLSAWLIVHAIEAAFIAPDSGIESLLK